MFFENEFTAGLTFLLLVLALVIGTSPLGATFAIKLVLFRRRLAEEGALAPREWRIALASESTLNDFAVALANEIEKFRRLRRLQMVDW